MILSGAAREPGCAEDARVELEKLGDAFPGLAAGNDGPIPRAPRDELKRQLAAGGERNQAVLRAITEHLETHQRQSERSRGVSIGSMRSSANNIIGSRIGRRVRTR